MKSAAFVLLFGLATGAAAAPLESDALYLSAWTRTQAQSVADEASTLIMLYGYRCDSVSSLRPWTWRSGVTVFCNSFRYKYEIEDKGGRWLVTVK